MQCNGCDKDIYRGSIAGDNIVLNRQQENHNWQNGGNWGNGDFINQRQNGGFTDNF